MAGENHSGSFGNTPRSSFMQSKAVGLTLQTRAHMSNHMK